MLHIIARNVNDAYSEALWKMRLLGVEADSRNGKVKRIPGPVVTTYYRPTERMLLDPVRDANPFFHIFEGIWMLAGRRDVEWISQFNSNISQFSDNGKTFHGAYGYRWRENWGHDQLVWIIEHLRKNPDSRRAVLQMYDPDIDQWDKDDNAPSDIPCNTAIYFCRREERLDMTVSCRSNDMIWGCYGANAVHMSMLQEFIALALGLEVGQYIQFSNDFHIYERHFNLLDFPPDDEGYLPKMEEGGRPLTSKERWGGDLIQFEQWIANPDREYDTPYIVKVLKPMLAAWKAYKQYGKAMATIPATGIKDVAVGTACIKWLLRRK